VSPLGLSPLGMPVKVSPGAAASLTCETCDVVNTCNFCWKQISSAVRKNEIFRDQGARQRVSASLT